MNLRDDQLALAGQVMITPRAVVSASPGIGAFVAVAHAMKELGMEVTVATRRPLIPMRTRDLELLGVKGRVTTSHRLRREPPGEGALILDEFMWHASRLPTASYERVVYILANDANLPNGFHVEPFNDRSCV